MTNKAILELLGKIKSLVSLQRDFLDNGNWEDFDLAEAEIQKLESRIIENRQE